jgi:tetratricopeptide (TPR) repeat protein
MKPIMQRNRKATALAMAALLLAGCARSDFKVSARERETWRPVANAAIAEASEAKLPKVLPQTHLAAARLFELQGLLDKAIAQYRKAIAVNHTCVEAYHRLGLVLSVSGRHEEAIKALSRAVELQPHNAILRNDLGFELLLARRWTDAERELSKATELTPGFARAYVNLGMVQSRRGRFEDALASFRAALPEPDAYYNLGLMYRGQQLYENAAEAFRHVLAIEPEFSSARTQLEQLASLLGVGEQQEVTPPLAASTPATEQMGDSVFVADALAQEGMFDAADWADEPCEEPMSATFTEGSQMAAVDRKMVQPTFGSLEVDMVAAAETGKDEELWTEEEPCPEEGLSTAQEPSPEGELWTEAELQVEQEIWIEQEPCEEEELFADAAGEEAISMSAPEEVQFPTAEAAHEEPAEAAAPAESFAPGENVVLAGAALSIIEPAGLPMCVVESETKQPARETCSLVPWMSLEQLEQELDIVQNEIACLEEMAEEAAWVSQSAKRDQAGALGRLQRVVEVGPGPLFPTHFVRPMGPPAERATERHATTTQKARSGERRREARLVAAREVIPPNSAAETTPRESGKTSNARPGVSRKATPVIKPVRRKTMEPRGDWREGLKELETRLRIVSDEIACWREVDLRTAREWSGEPDPQIDTLICDGNYEICPVSPSDSREAPYDLPGHEPLSGFFPY